MPVNFRKKIFMGIHGYSWTFSLKSYPWSFMIIVVEKKFSKILRYSRNSCIFANWEIVSLQDALQRSLPHSGGGTQCSKICYNTLIAMRLFLTEDTTENYATLSAEESKHCVRVLRMSAGDEVWVTSGDGTMCRAIVSDPDDKACEVEIVERLHHYGKRPFGLHIAVAPTKNTARLEWFIEKAVEIGIDRITPIVCDHSERGVLKTDRLEKIALSAMKQSLKAQKPQIDEAVRLCDWLKDAASEMPEARFVCYCSGDERHSLHELYTAGSDALVLIGPEGDFSEKEIKAVLEQGFQPVTLGASRLRTETAALYATTVLNFLNEK